MSLEEDPQESAESCAPFLGQLSDFLSGELSRAEQERLRVHLAGCGSCREHFDSGVGLAAQLNRRPRRNRDEAVRNERRKAQRSRALAAALRIPGSDRGARLRLLLLPVLAIFLFTQVARGPRVDEGLGLESWEGSVRVGERTLVADGPRQTVRPGESCETGTDGRACLGTSEGQLELGPRTWLWLEDSNGPRLRLGGGELIARGRATVTSRAGVVEVHGGAARLRLDGESGLEVEALSGETSVVDSLGLRAVAPGEVVRLAAR